MAVNGNIPVLVTSTKAIQVQQHWSTIWSLSGDTNGKKRFLQVQPTTQHTRCIMTSHNQTSDMTLQPNNVEVTAAIPIMVVAVEQTTNVAINKSWIVYIRAII